jgi:TatD DNase family protein
MWFDSHCHISDIEDETELASVVKRAHEAGVHDMVVLGTDAATSRRAAAITRLEGVWAGAAFHPTSVKGWEDAWAEEIDALLGEPRVVAVGETGIDLYWDRSYLFDQQAAFRTHIALAKEHDKALVIHTRDSLEETLAMLEAESPPARLVFHCWSGDRDQMERAVALGSYISFAGNITYKSAGDLREASRFAPADRLLVETDSPYLAPVPKRGKENEPAFVTFVGAAVAEARGETVEEVARATDANARRLFGLER